MAEDNKKMTGSDLTVKVLEEQGVDTVFSFPGGVVIPLFDAFYTSDTDIKQYEPCHEQHGVHAADGYARSTGKVGVAITTSGPGATNTVTGVATAYLDSIPIVVITGQVTQDLLGKDSFQEVDISSIVYQITKHSFLVTDPTMLAATIREAFRIAKSGRPGPVVIDIPKDIFMAEMEYHPKEVVDTSGDKPKAKRDAILRAAEFIEKAERPVIYAGGGVIKAGASDILRKFAKKTGIPVANSLMGLGSIDRNDELSLGFIGMHGSNEGNLAVINADTIIAIGSRFSDRATGNINSFMRDKKIIHIDIDPTEFEKNVATNVHIMGDAKDVLEQLYQIVDENEYPEWYKQIEEWKVEHSHVSDFTPQDIIHSINEVFPDAFIVTEVGQHQMWIGQEFKFKFPGQLITSGGLGTMGFGLGASYGVQIGNPDADVLLFAGDGSFRMNCNELITLKRYNIPVKIFLFDNNSLGMVRQWQDLFQEGRYAETDLNVNNEVDYLKLAEASGIKAYNVENQEDLDKALEEIKDLREPVLVRCKIDHDEGVYPIVPAGNPIDELYYK